MILARRIVWAIVRRLVAFIDRVADHIDEAERIDPAEPYRPPVRPDPHDAAVLERKIGNAKRRSDS